MVLNHRVNVHKVQSFMEDAMLVEVSIDPMVSFYSESDAPVTVEHETDLFIDELEGRDNGEPVVL